MNSRPHILILPMYYPEKDSSPHRGYMFHEQAEEAARAGCRIGLAFTEQRPLKKLSIRRFFNESHFQISREDNGRFVTFRMHAWNPKLSTRPGALIWCLLTLILVGRYIRKEGKPDLIHAHFGMWAGYAARWVRKIYGIPYIVTEHASSINAGTVSKHEASVIRKAYAKASAILCVGTMLARNLDKHVGEPSKITVLPNFVDTSTFRLSERETDKNKDFRFISVGNLTPRKDFTTLIDCFCHEFRDSAHVSLWIAGDGEQYQELQQQIRNTGMQERIHLLGNLTREELSEQLQQCDAFVLPSLRETFGIVFIEAMATGMPAIGTICGGPEDIIHENSGYLLDPGDGEALSRKLKELYLNYEQFDRRMIRNHIRKNFDFSLAGEKLKTIYQKQCGMTDKQIHD